MRFLQFAPTRISANGILHNITFEDERTLFMEKQNWSIGVKIRGKSQKSEDEEKTVSSFIAGYYYQCLFSLYDTAENRLYDTAQNEI